MAKLSPTMSAALEAIRVSGGEVWPEQGGWWQDITGHRIMISVPGYRENDFIGSNTIYALERRGLLEKIPNSGNRVHSAYRLTESADD